MTGCINDGTDSSPTPSPVNTPIYPPVDDRNSILVTDTDTNIKSPGVIFDIYAPEGDIVVEAFDIFVNSQPDLGISIYSKQGSYVNIRHYWHLWRRMCNILFTLICVIYMNFFLVDQLIVRRVWGYRGGNCKTVV